MYYEIMNEDSWSTQEVNKNIVNQSISIEGRWSTAVIPVLQKAETGSFQFLKIFE